MDEVPQRARGIARSCSRLRLRERRESIIFGTGITSAVPHSIDGLQLTVFDIEAARAELVRRGVDVSEIFHDAGGVFPTPAPREGCPARRRAASLLRDRQSGA
jgi:hypothetical protein